MSTPAEAKSKFQFELVL